MYVMLKWIKTSFFLLIYIYCFLQIWVNTFLQEALPQQSAATMALKQQTTEERPRKVMCSALLNTTDVLIEQYNMEPTITNIPR